MLKRLRDMNATKAERIAKTAPKGIRESVKQEIESVAQLWQA